MTNIKDKLLGKKDDSMCKSLTFKQRVTGWLVCLALGMFFSMRKFIPSRLAVGYCELHHFLDREKNCRDVCNHVLFGKRDQHYGVIQHPIF